VVLNCTKRVCLAAAYWLYPNITNHAANSAMCDEELANWTKISKEPFMNGLETIIDATWCGNVFLRHCILKPNVCQDRQDETNIEKLKRYFCRSQFPDATGKGFEFINSELRFDTREMGLRCDEFRRSLPSTAKYRPWVKAAFADVPSSPPSDEKYTPAAAAARAKLRSGKALVLNFTEPCPPLLTSDCQAIWVAWGAKNAFLEPFLYNYM
jgi:hypothetical protein